MKHCTIEGCTKVNPKVVKGMCMMHYMRNRKHGNPNITLVHQERHGKYLTPEYRTWRGMIDRCYNKNSKSYNNYGGRGIKVCDRWKNSFKNFLHDIGERPNNDYSLDRIDNNGNYEPGNCKWSTREEQQNNTRKNVLLTFSGKTMTQMQWSHELKMHHSVIARRLRKGWSIEKTLTTPKMKNQYL